MLIFSSFHKKSYAFALAATLVSGLLSGCGTTSDTATNGTTTSEADGKKLQIVASFYPMAEFTRQVAGDLANVTTLVPAGVEPHDWEPSAEHMKTLSKAEVFVYNGVGMEGFVQQTLESLNRQDLTVVEASKEVTLIEGTHDHTEDHHGHEAEASAKEEHAHDELEHDELEHDELEHADKHADEHAAHADEHRSVDPETGLPLDPHVWLSPIAAQQQVRTIQAALAAKDPANAATYQKNADAYVAKLQTVDRAFKDAVNGAKRKEFITQHAAFGYLANAYGLNQIGISGMSPEQEPSAGKLAEIAEIANSKGIQYILFETLVSSKVAETLANEIGAKTAVLNPIEGLTEADLAAGKDYITLMTENAATLKKALSE
jgi:zinc transport system substrate-binding protein